MSESDGAIEAPAGPNRKPLILVGALAALLAAAFLLPVAEWITALLAWVDANRTFSWAVFVVVYIAATVLLLPGSLLTLAAGFLFGVPFGYALVAVGSVVGASCAFLLGRTFARDWIKQRIAGNARFAALDAAVEDRGFVLVLLTRLSPVFPFNLLNYALGITSVKFPHYVLASWIGMIPGTLLYVYLGSVAQDLSSLFDGGSGEAGNWLFYVGLAATLVLTVFITRFATKALNAELDGDATTEATA
ncbi:MAG: TVP38/TMEM64 family protein [Pseudomonadota bacterium]